MDSTLVTMVSRQHSLSRLLLALTLVPGAGPIAIRRLLDGYDLPSLLAAPDGAGLEVTDARDRELLAKVAEIGLPKLLDWADQQLAEAERRHVRVVTCVDPGFPPNLRESSQSPPVLFIRGSIEARDSRSVAIVGSREASVTGRERARSLGELLAEQEFTVVSGLARGIDTAAHGGALAAGGRSVAVVGTGLDRTYPAENAELAKRLSESGALISQFPFGTPPLARNFPMRNKTMAILSLATVVVEAGPTSGAKMQADFALRSESPKRYVFLLQSLIDSQRASGWPSNFVRRGAAPFTDAEDVMKVLSPMSKSVWQPQLPL